MFSAFSMVICVNWNIMLQVARAIICTSAIENKSRRESPGGITAHPEVDRLPEAAFHAPQDLPVPAHWTKSGLIDNRRAGYHPAPPIETELL
jgi:hypothetical protein